MRSILKKPKRTLSFDSVLLILVMVMMSVVMVMMMPVTALVSGGITGQLVAMLVGRFEFKSCVRNAVFCEFLANGFLDVMCIAIYYCVERCIIVMSVHTPNMYVVNILDALYVHKVLANFINFDTVRCFFKEQVNCFL